MSDHLEHQECSELLGAYVLHSVDPIEARRVDLHLEGCARCRQELDDLRRVAAGLGTVVDACPPAVWDRIADLLAARPSGDPRAEPRGEGERTAPGTPETFPGPVWSPEQQRCVRDRPGTPGTRRGTWRHRMLSGAGAAAVIALGTSLGVVLGQASSLRSEIAQRGPGVAVASAVAVPGHRVVVLRSADGTELAELVVRPDGAGFVVRTSTPVLPGDESYQLWAYIAHQPISLGLLGPQVRSGAPFSIGSAASGGSTVMMTVEPSGGVVTPDRAPVATGALPAG